MNLTHLSLFSGIGGIDLAAHWAGFETVGFVEKEPFCQKILTKNFPGVPIYDDITTFDGTRYRGVDLISGGFPCQPFSVAGKRKGTSDARHLWPEMLRVIREAQPTWVLGENVAGLLSIDGGRVFGDAISGLADLGYCVGWGVLSAYAVGACHYRRRVFIVAHANSKRPCERRDSDTIGEIPGTIKERRNRESSENQGTNALGGGASHSKRFRCPRTSESEGRDCTQIEGRMQVLGGSFGDTAGVRCGVQAKHGELGRQRFSISNSWQELSRNWRAWEIEPVVRGAHDGLSPRLDAPRIRALGNAVVPQQCYPILKAIAETYGEKSLEVKI